MTLILGINAHHPDAAACVLRDGRLLAAVEEERLNRIKHCTGFPERAIAYCLREARAELRDVDHVALNYAPRARWLPRIAFVTRHRPNVDAVMHRLQSRRRRDRFESDIRRGLHAEGLSAETHYVEHHLAHLASAALLSGEVHCSAVSVDQFGDFASAAFGHYAGAPLRLDHSIPFPHSLGTFYTAMTQYLGFRGYGDEYKVMGLAAYGQPKFKSALERVVTFNDRGHYRLTLDYFRHHRDRIEFQGEGGRPRVSTLYSEELAELLGPARRPGDPVQPRHRDIAASTQLMYELALFRLLGSVHTQHRDDNLALAGGCAFNSVANGKITTHTPFRKLYVQPAAGDAGGALGAALVVNQRVGNTRMGPMRHAFWGSRYDDQEIETAIGARHGDLERASTQVRRMATPEALCAEVARRLDEGAVVGWFQGRAEWGPRALGNRSILCDPRRADARDLLNRKIKRREPFRPFAPSILRREVSTWFERDEPSPFMERVLTIRAERRPQIPAVTHVDGTGRLQTVEPTTNPLYHRLIEAFFERTGVPMVLNTSFNENEPIVCTPAEALDCFLRTGMDAVALGSWLVERQL